MQPDRLFEAGIGVALYSSRRFVEIFAPNSGKHFLGTIAQRGIEITPGDLVNFTHDKTNNSEEHVTISGICERKNLLKRSYDKKTKLLAANLNAIWIITAPPPLFNSIAVDRTLTAANNENIPVILIANKADLPEFAEFKKTIDHYKSLTAEVFDVSAKKKIGLENLKQNSEHELEIIAVAGISGVGKSSLVSTLYPQTLALTGEVSSKTGQGKQTTSAAKGHVIDYVPGKRVSILIDLPGIQNYGVSHLSENEITSSMHDILKFSTDCKFRNCMHLKEPDCRVLEALRNSELKESRYRSLLDMLEEKKRLKEY